MNSDIVVEVLEGQPDERSGTFKNDAGEEIEYSTRKQKARLEAGGFAYPYDVRLEKDQKPFAPGRYRMNPTKMLTVNKGVHGFSKYPVLEPVAAGK
jgi:hypothetical protein